MVTRILGIMSGTSCDGVDFALVAFKTAREYSVICTQTIPYTDSFRKRLRFAHELPGVDLVVLSWELGELIGKSASAFLREKGEEAHYIASHGHTVFHSPPHYTHQIGCGAAIARHAGIDTICDFRSTNVACGGQGAPLVPLGDALLYSSYDVCLNIGGIANASTSLGGERVAFDVCPACMVLNHVAEQIGVAYDKDGKIARDNHIHAGLLDELEALAYYGLPAPKTLGKEFFLSSVEPTISHYRRQHALTWQEILATLTEHVARRIAADLNQLTRNHNGERRFSVLCTGGGVQNTHLMDRIAEHLDPAVGLVVPSRETVEFKEAIVFALLGYLRTQERPNVLTTYTGALQNVSGGALYLAPVLSTG